jgi:hypothetical protein
MSKKKLRINGPPRIIYCMLTYLDPWRRNRLVHIPFGKWNCLVFGRFTSLVLKQKSPLLDTFRVNGLPRMCLAVEHEHGHVFWNKWVTLKSCMCVGFDGQFFGQKPYYPAHSPITRLERRVCWDASWNFLETSRWPGVEPRTINGILVHRSTEKLIRSCWGVTRLNFAWYFIK